MGLIGSTGGKGGGPEPPMRERRHLPCLLFWIQHSKRLDRREEGLQNPQGVVMETVFMIMNREQGKKYTTLAHCIDEALEAREGTRGT